MRSSSLRRVRSVAIALTTAALTIPLSVVGLAPASAASAPTWGEQGRATTDSAVTARWDNAGNTPGNTVPRDERQVVPLTGGKTYDDVAESLRQTWERMFSGLEITVSQTTGLVNQTLTVDVAGLPSEFAESGGGRNPDQPYLAILQCWGAPQYDASGAFIGPDPNATEPDPRTCQEGTGGLGQSLEASERSLGSDPLAVDGPYWTPNLRDARILPLLSVGGEEVVSNSSGNPFFNPVGTNEQPRVTAGRSGTTSVSFDAQTGAESNFLGCGEREGAASTGTCWLVVAPVSGTYVNREYGYSRSPLAPSIWAQRMQVQLDFAPVAGTCPNGRARLLSQGSELVGGAMESWIPGLCDAASISSGYTQVSDAQARRALAAGSAEFALTTDPAPAADVHVPVGLAAVAFAYTIDYLPCGGAGTGDLSVIVERCGYADVNQAAVETAKAGSAVRELNLNARIVAKLLTESYGKYTMPVSGILEKAGAVLAHDPDTIFRDPEFQALNPQLRFQQGVGAASQLNRIEVENLPSDAAAAVWRWIVADEDARTFLNGCPDPSGLTINPWYSSRTYDGCDGEATALEKVAAEKRDATDTPSTFNRDAPPSYPPTVSAYPQALYIESDQIAEPGNTAYVAPGSLVDMFPPVADHLAGARNTSRGLVQRGAWCFEYSGGCFPPLWKASATALTPKERGVMTITDTANAARFQLPTASLCDSETNCIAANPRTLTKKASEYTSTGASSPLTAGVSDGYPLLAPVYAAFNTAALTQSSAAGYADLLEWVTTSGQSEGTEQGELRPGYVPLTGAFATQATAGIAALRAVRDEADAPLPGANTSPNVNSPVATGPVFVPKTVAPPAEAAAPAPVLPPSTAEPVARPGGRTGATEVGFPQYGLLFGLGGAVLAGLLVPALGRSRKASEE